MLDYLICDLLCALDYLKYLIPFIAFYVVYNKVSKY